MIRNVWSEPWEEPDFGLATLDPTLATTFEGMQDLVAPSEAYRRPVGPGGTPVVSPDVDAVGDLLNYVRAKVEAAYNDTPPRSMDEL
jgi:hypothetical protein